ncbi:MAG TPA: response regulator transcription factor [Desulfatirhabdiaceae bacterium]|nr:response regulator transcription factor [Desulfatirhabdiaceae bacterium]
MEITSNQGTTTYPRVMVVDDDEKLNRLLVNFMSQYGFEVHGVLTPSEAWVQLPKFQPEIIILDYMLPETNGFEFLRKLRKTSELPVIMLTARGDPNDRIAGLELGADDYLSKPFEPRELVARIQAVLRRTDLRRSRAEFLPACIRAGDLELFIERREVCLRGKYLDFSSAEFEILKDLMVHSGVIRTRDQILDQVKGMNADIFTRTIDVTLSRIRQKLGEDPKHPVFIRTIYGGGYLFIPPVEQ